MDARQAIGAAVTRCRRILLEDRNFGDNVADQLAAPFGFDRETGVPLPIDRMGHLTAQQRGTATLLREWHAHIAANGNGHASDAQARAAYDEMRYELAYTTLHRLCALRMAEVRGFLPHPVIAQGINSAGFQLYLRIAENAIGGAEDAYRSFLERVFDEIAADLPALFDRRIAPSAIFPGPRALTALVEQLGAPELEEAWKLPDTLGWMFEDFNDANERREMRLHAPRNVRELAVRNQFFTPRWVVEFLTDNSLGRLWVERGPDDSALRQACAYLVDRARPADAPPMPDPRELRVLDPACGSGHFLVYAFDLLEVIWLEAWDANVPPPKRRWSLRRSFPDRDAFRAKIPVLILKHNLYGIDIDPRCTQEAALTLWLRAQESFQKLERDGLLKRKDRPRIERFNLVCPRAMGGSRELFEKYLATIEQPVLRRLMTALMQRVGELGVLQKTETAIADTIADVRKEFEAWDEERRSPPLLADAGDAGGPLPDVLDFEEMAAAGVGDFWIDAEVRLREALCQLTEASTGRDHLRRRLLAADIRDGLEFFDISRQTYDVVLMNPPFGEPSEDTKEFLEASYVNAGGDLFAMFVERGLEMLSPGGRLGAITNRTWLALPSFEPYRTRILGPLGAVEAAADLGSFVLNAQVEVVMYVVSRSAWADTPARWIRLLKTRKKAEVLLEAVRDATHPNAYSVPARQFEQLPANVFGYWMSSNLMKVFGRSKPVGTYTNCAVGLQTSKDFRFLRLAWEVRPEQIGLLRDWPRFAKGGEYRPWYDDVHLVVRWTRAGEELATFPKSYIRNPQSYGTPGVTWPRRTTSPFGPRVQPPGCAFGDKGPVASPKNPAAVPTAVVLAVLCSTPSRLLLSVRLGAGDDAPGSASKSYEKGLVEALPWPELSGESLSKLTLLGTRAAALVQQGQIEDDRAGETVAAFAFPPVLRELVGDANGGLISATQARTAAREDRVQVLATIQAEVDDLTATGYAFDDRDRAAMDEELEPALARLSGREPINEGEFARAYCTKDQLDGSKLPGGEEADRDVRVESRRKRQTKALRTEATLCRLFEASPSRIAENRRRLGLIRDVDVTRSARDLVSYAVGVAFGRWDVRLGLHPTWIAAFADPFDAVPHCSLGQLVNADGLPATELRIASESWLRARRDPTRLPPNAVGAEVDARAYPASVAWDGLLGDDEFQASGVDSLSRRVSNVFKTLFGPNAAALEAEIAHALGAETVAEWLRDPNGFFDEHLTRYTKSDRAAPIYWPISTSTGGLIWWVYAPKFDAERVRALANRTREAADRLRDRLAKVEHLLASGGAAAVALREERERLVVEIPARQQLEDELRRLDAGGYRPHPDDGFVVTASPLHFAFRNVKWRDRLAETWAEVQAGGHLWAHLSMTVCPEKVIAGIAEDPSLCIAHGLDPKKLPTPVAPRPGSVMTAPAAPKRRAKKASPAAKSLPLPLGQPEEDA